MQVDIEDTLIVVFQNDLRASSASRIGILMSRMSPSSPNRNFRAWTFSGAVRVRGSQGRVWHCCSSALCRWKISFPPEGACGHVGLATAAGCPSSGCYLLLRGPGSSGKASRQALNFAECSAAMLASVQTLSPILRGCCAFSTEENRHRCNAAAGCGRGRCMGRPCHSALVRDSCSLPVSSLRPADCTRSRRSRLATAGAMSSARPRDRPPH